MLHEIELLVRSRRPEIIALDNVALTTGLALLADNRGAAFLAERRVGQHQIEAIAGISGRWVKYWLAPVLVSWAFFSVWQSSVMRLVF